MNIQSFVHSDIPVLPALQPEGWVITPAFEFYTCSPFCFPIKVVMENKIIGIGTTVIHNDVAWLAHIIVHPEYRNKGIGRLITKTLVESLKKTDCSTIYLIATDLGAPVYERLGFQTETEYLFFKGIEKKSANIISDAVLPYRETYKMQIVNLDKQVSGEDRMLQLEPHLVSSYLYLENNKVEGYYLPDLGEGLIIADTTDAGLALMNLRLIEKDNAVIPVDNKKAIDFLHQKGYTEFKFAKRMILGKQRKTMLGKMYNRISGSLG